MPVKLCKVSKCKQPVKFANTELCEDHWCARQRSYYCGAVAKSGDKKGGRNKMTNFPPR